MATLTVQCNACGKQFTVPDSYVGRAGKCTKCGKAMTVPASAVPATNPAMHASDEQLSTFAPSGKAPADGGGAPAAPGGGKAVTIGSTLAGYKLHKKLGDAKSMVLLADSPQGARVAVKVLPQEVVSRSPTAGKRFLREARSLFGLAHPNVVTLLDAGEELGCLYLAMEYFEGRPLRELIAERGKIAEPEAIKIARQIASGIGHLEKHKLVHRNVRPEHLLVDSKGNVKIVGLGLVRSSEGDAPVTVQGLLVGVPQDMAPENATDPDAVDHRGDFFSLGVTLYEMLAGEVPWNDKSAMKVLQLMRNTPPPDLREKSSGVSPATALVVGKLLKKDPAARYQSADVLVKDLEAIEKLQLVNGEPPSFAPAGAAAPPTADGASASDALVKKLVALVAVLVVLVLVMLVALVVALSKK